MATRPTAAAAALPTLQPFKKPFAKYQASTQITEENHNKIGSEISSKKTKGFGI
ncbi:uncharacterized protein G2W53_021144 [Senna tora]|uniref:Uncharacterized protein n=1 Tax=Senna tora TaxID=362788 RepID=A0A834TLD7_9FABA|nr:uncharacterized protein G2W53_021144 [Senna tora]